MGVERRRRKCMSRTMMMHRWRRSGDFIRSACKSLSSIRPKHNPMSPSVSGFVNHCESKGKTFESFDTELDHRPCLSRNLWMMQQYKSFGSSSASKVQRNPFFSSLEPKEVSYFNEILGEKHAVEDEEGLETANTDWMHKYKGYSKLLLLPKNTKEVSQILKYCDSRSLAVVPQGGNTGLVGGSVPVLNKLFFSYFKDLVGQEVTVELKNDLAITETLHSVDQYLNIKLENTRVQVPSHASRKSIYQ
ncbi:hypothetical protein Bca4012_019875 [Brassica carinata]